MSANIDEISMIAGGGNAVSSIDWGTKINGSVITYSFAAPGTKITLAEAFGIGGRYTAEGFNAYEEAQFRAAFDLFESVTNITFQETGNYASADLRLVLDTNQFGGLGVMSPPGESGAGIGVFNGDGWDRQAGGDLDVGGYAFVTIVHELLHGLGLAHPHDTGGTSNIMPGVSEAFDDFGNHNLNQGIYTTMTYNTGQLFDSGIGGLSPDPSASYGYEAGPMALDIAVLQDKYGANMSHATGNDVYDLPDKNATGTYWMSIWDAGGKDMIRYQGSRDTVIDLRQATLKDEPGGGGFLSAADGIRGGFTVANGVVIENAQGGSGSDEITGNGADNTLTGADGHDSIKGGGGEDTLNGNRGHDTLAGGKGDDTLNAGDGRDSLVGQAGEDVLNGGTGSDTLKGGGATDTLNGNDGGDFLKGGTKDDILSGNKQDDRLFGNRDADTINGGSGNDTLNGGGEDDRLNGGSGNDTLKGGAGADAFVFAQGGDSDVVLDFTLGEDALRIDADLLSGQSTGQAVVNAFGSVQGGDVVLDFGGGDVIRIEGVSSLNALASDIEIF